MPWGVVVGAVVGGIASNSAAKKGAKATRDATNATVGEQQRQFDLTRQDQAPWMEAGRDALGKLQALNSGDYSGFMNSPDYIYARDQGMEGINRQLAAHGGYYSGGGDADRMKFLSGLATQNLSNYRGSLQSMAGLGQSTAAGLGSLGMTMAGNVGNALMANGQARASSYAQQGNNYAQLASGLGNAFAYWNQSRQPAYSAPQTTNNYNWASSSGFGNNYANTGGGYYGTAGTFSGYTG